MPLEGGAELKMSSDGTFVLSSVCFFAPGGKMMELNGCLVTSAVFYTILRPQHENCGSPLAFT